MKTRTHLKSRINEDWATVIIAWLFIAIALLFTRYIPASVGDLTTLDGWIRGGKLFAIVTALTYLAKAITGEKSRGTLLSLLVIFLLSVCGGAISKIPIIESWGLEPVFFAVIIGLIISNIFTVPAWLKPAIQSEFYIKIGIVCLGSTILIGDIMRSGMYGLAQSLIVVLAVWNFTFWLARRMNIDNEMGTMLSSAVSICGVSAAIATCGVIQGNSKKLSYVISLVLVCAIPMMYLMPLAASWMGLSAEVAGAWIGGTIDTTGAVAASGEMIGEVAAQTAIIVKSSQNVLLGIAAFAISLFWSTQNQVQTTDGQSSGRPTLKMIWSRFPKFVVGFIAASLIFSLLIEPETARSVSKITKGMTTTLFSLAFVCIGLETRFAEIFSKENRQPLYLFLTAQLFNIIFTLLIAYLIFGVLKPAL